MNFLSVLKSLASGFLPLFVYIGAELIFGETIGLLAGLGMGILEFAFSLAREKKADLFIAADTLLLAAMGLLSLLLRNQLFFRLKPAVIEALMAIAMIVLLALPGETLKNYMEHQVKGLRLEESAMPALRRNLVMMVLVLAVHAAFTLWAAFAAGMALWGFVSGGLLYIMLSLAFLGQWISARRTRKARMNPSLPLGMKADFHPISQPGESFPWNLLIFDETGCVLAEKSSADAKLWDNPARGMASGEAELEAKLGQVLAGLGIGGLACGMEAGSVSVRPVSVQPAFIIESNGSVSGLPAAPAAAPVSAAFTETFLRMKPSSTLVLVALVGRAAFPKGIDPTRRRLWPLSDLEALAAQDRLSPLFAKEIRAIASIRRPLRMAEEPSIVTDTNGALF